jgi:hypothetical protein
MTMLFSLLFTLVDPLPKNAQTIRLVTEQTFVIPLQTQRLVDFALQVEFLLARMMANVLLQETSPDLVPSATFARLQVPQQTNVMSDLIATRTLPPQP